MSRGGARSRQLELTSGGVEAGRRAHVLITREVALAWLTPSLDSVAFRS
jgi:hypothetical protein